LSVKEADVDEKWHRLIPSRFPPVEVYETFGDSEIVEIAKALEAKTNPRLKEKAWQLEGRSVRENSPALQNWNHAPFAYPNPEGSTFLDPAYSVLEMVRGVRPALARALRRREQFLQRTSEPPLGVDMRLLITPVKGRFVDLSEAAIDPNQANRWAMGKGFYDEGKNGILFRSPEQPASLSLSIFNNTVLGRSVQATHYRFVWDGNIVSKIYDFADGSELTRSEVLSEGPGLAAA